MSGRKNQKSEFIANCSNLHTYIRYGFTFSTNGQYKIYVHRIISQKEELFTIVFILLVTPACFSMAEKSKLITTLMSEFVYDLFEKRKNHSNFLKL